MNWYLASFDEFGVKTKVVTTGTQEEHDTEKQRIVDTAYAEEERLYLISTPETHDEETKEWVSFLSNPYNRQWGFMNDPDTYNLDDDNKVHVTKNNSGPNIEVSEYGIFALRNIKAGEELLFEYGENYPWAEALRKK